jgi:hypothetical protein
MSQSSSSASAPNKDNEDAVSVTFNEVPSIGEYNDLMKKSAAENPDSEIGRFISARADEEEAEALEAAEQADANS